MKKKRRPAPDDEPVILPFQSSRNPDPPEPDPDPDAPPDESASEKDEFCRKTNFAIRRSAPWPPK